MSPRLALGVVLSFAALFTACPKAPPPAPPTPPQLSPEERLAREVEALTERTRALLAAQDEAIWANWTEGKPLDLGTTAEQGRALYTREAIDLIAAQRKATSDPLDARALDQLRLHFISEYVAGATSAETDEATRLESTLSFKAGEQEHALRDLERLLARERNALRRQELYEAAAAAMKPLDEALARRRARTVTVLNELGYSGTLSFSGDLRRADLAALSSEAERILEVTEAPFRKVLDELAQRELRMPSERLRMRDLPRLFRSRDVDELFPKEAIHSRVEATLRGLGVELSAHPEVRLDLRDAPAKNPLPLALAVSVPSDVRVSLKPLPGLRVQSAYLHEMGHAVHAAFTQERRYPLAKLSAGSASEAWSLLFELLVEDRVWLEQQAALTGARLDRYLAASAAWDLYLLRRAAGRFLYEYAVQTQERVDEAALFRSLMQRALGVTIEDADISRRQLERDEFFSSATTLEAEILAHQLQAQLKARFGPSWWTSKEAGDYLRPLWAHGNALNARELAREAGDDALRADALLLRLTSTLKLPIAVPNQPSGTDE